MLPALLLFFTIIFIHLNLSFSSYDIDSLTTNQVFTISGASTTDQLGYSVNSAGDINKDGYEDFLVGSMAHNNYMGAVYVVYGKSTLSDIDLSSQSLNPSTTGFAITGRATGDYLGCAINAAGDINGDGYDDIIIGAQKAYSYRGAVYVIYGQPTASFTNIDLSTITLDPKSTGFVIKGASITDRLGFSVGSAGKFNEDKYDDIIIGAYIKDNYKGGAYIIYGKATSSLTNIDLSTTTLDSAKTGFLVSGSEQNSQLGMSVNSAGDFNNDGYNDVIIGANAYNTMQGAAYVIYGNLTSSLSNINLSTTTLDPSSTGIRLFGKQQNSHFGRSVKTAGDINGDGYSDIIIGAYMERSTLIGAIYVVYGGSTSSRVNYNFSTDTLDPQSTGFVIKGSTSALYLGSTVGTAGDLDNDGYDDIIFASNAASSDTTGIGYVVYGRPTKDLTNIDLSTDTLDPTSTGFTVTGVATRDQLGYSIGAGDFNNDGKPELIFGVQTKLRNRGTAYVLYPSQICLDNCDECSYPETCKTCSYGFKLLENFTCVGCLTGFYSDSGSCKVCPEGCSECTSKTVCQACYDGYTLLGSFTCFNQDYSTSALNTTGTSFEGTSVLTSFLTPGSSLPVIFGLVAKLIRNTKYLDVHVSNKLQTERFAWKTSSSFLASPSSWSSKSESKSLPYVFSQYAMESIFLVNYWKPLVMMIGGLVFFVMFKSLENSVKKERKFWHTAARALSIIASNFALTQFYSNLDDVLFFLVLDVRSATFDTAFRYVSIVAAILLLIIVVIALGLHLVFLKRYQRHKKLQLLGDFLYKYENAKLLFRDYKDNSLFQQTFLLFHVTRALISNLITTTLFEYPVLQTSILTLCSISIVLFLIFQRPFKDIVNILGQYFCEIILLMANASMLVMAIFDSESFTQADAVEKLSQLIIIVNMILFYGGMAFMLFGLFKNFYDVYQTKRRTKALQTKSLTNDGLRMMSKPDQSFENSTLDQKDFVQTNLPHIQIEKYPSSHQSKSIYFQESHTITRTVLYSQNPSLNTTNLDPPINPRGGYFNPVNRFLNSLPQGFNSDSQIDDSLNMSNTNLLPHQVNFGVLSQMHKPKRGKIKMPEGYQRRRAIGRIPQENRQEIRDWGNYESAMSTQVDPQGLSQVPVDHTALASGKINPADYEEFLRRREIPQQLRNKQRIRKFNYHQ